MKYVLICNNCGQKHFTNGTNFDGLTEVKSASPPKNANGISKDVFELQKKFKCYNCGYLFKLVKNPMPAPEKPQKEEFNEINDEQYLNQWQNEVLKSARKKGMK